MINNTSTLRHQWLNRAAKLLAKRYKQLGRTVPAEVRVAVGMPSRKRFIGECWANEASSDKHAEIFISAKLPSDDAVKMLEVLAHELAHAIHGHKVGHKKPFIETVRAIGLEGKPTATHPGPAFKQLVEPWLADPKVLGKYPVGHLNGGVLAGGPKKQTVRMIKCECPECGYTVRTSRQWLEQGAPLCPVDLQPMPPAGDGK